MRIKIHVLGAFCALASTAFVFSSCQKDEMSGNSSTSSEDLSSTTIAVASSLSSSSVAGSTDSVYLLQKCDRGSKRDSVTLASLPASVQSYIAANYAGATFKKAYTIKDGSSNITDYVVVIYYNDKPVGLQFDSTAAFEKVLEQREKSDLNGSGHHRGGRFEHRDGKQRDTVALAALPASVTAYFAGSYASDTLVKAFRNHDSSIVVLSKNAGVFATVFDANGVFVQRVGLPSKGGTIQSIELAALPSVAANYLAQTYPNYVFEKAVSFTQNGVVKGYLVLIDANNTEYAVAFDASGNFLKAKTIH